METFEKIASFFSPPKDILHQYITKSFEALKDGHICIPMNENDHDNLLNNSKYVGTVHQTNKPFIVHDSLFYIQKYYIYEKQIIDKIRLLIDQSTTQIISDKIIQFINNIFEKSDDIDYQKLAVINSFYENFSIITGGPGTGKTTTVTKLLFLLLTANPSSKIAIAAPTGKAGNRMKESIVNVSKLYADKVDQKIINKIESIVPQTLHRLLKINPQNKQTKFNNENPLNYDIIIIDESSMIDINLFNKLMQSVSISSKLVLLGDKNQLFSVEMGSFFRDLCTIENVINTFDEEKYKILNNIYPLNTTFINESPNKLTGKIIELKKSYRFKSNSGISIISKKILDQDPIIKNDFLYEDITLVDKIECPAIENFIKSYILFIKELDYVKAFQHFQDYRILCATNNGMYSTTWVQNFIEKYLIEHNILKDSELDNFYLGKPIMVVENNYEINLFNGDIGIVTQKDNKTMVYFGNNQFIPVELINNYQVAYAMTIHKSQGSEFNNLLMLMPTVEHEKIMSKELVYTGITRAKENLIILGTIKQLNHSMLLEVKRISGIDKKRF